MNELTQKEKTVILIRMYSEFTFYLALHALPAIIVLEIVEYFYGFPLSGINKYLFTVGEFFLISFAFVSSFLMLRSVFLWAEEQDKKKDSFLFFLEQAFLTGKDFFHFRYRTMLKDISRKSAKLDFKKELMENTDIGIDEYFRKFREAGASKRTAWMKSNRRVYQNGLIYFWFYSFYWRFRKTWLSSFAFTLGITFMVVGSYFLFL